MEHDSSLPDGNSDREFSMALPRDKASFVDEKCWMLFCKEHAEVGRGDCKLRAFILGALEDRARSVSIATATLYKYGHLTNLWSDRDVLMM